MDQTECILWNDAVESRLHLPNRFTRPTEFLSRLILINSLLIPASSGPNGLWRILLNRNSKQALKKKKYVIRWEIIRVMTENYREAKASKTDFTVFC